MVMLVRPSVMVSDSAGMMKYSSNAELCQLLRSMFALRQENKEGIEGLFYYGYDISSKCGL